MKKAALSEKNGFWTRIIERRDPVSRSFPGSEEVTVLDLLGKLFEGAMSGAFQFGNKAQNRSPTRGGAGIEPANRGFADPDLTTWLPRRVCEMERQARARSVNAAVIVVMTHDVSFDSVGRHDYDQAGR